MNATVVVRRIKATPARPAAETWSVIVGLISPGGSAARRELESIAGTAIATIADEAPRNSPIVLSGDGPRLRIYCLYDEEAILGEGESEAELTWCPTEGDWAMSLPCSSEDLDWVNDELALHTNRISARDRSDAFPSSEARAESADASTVDKDAFFRP